MKRKRGFCAPRRTFTADGMGGLLPYLVSPALGQRKVGGRWSLWRFSPPCAHFVRPGGFEPPTYCLEGSCSIH